VRGYMAVGGEGVVVGRRIPLRALVDVIMFYRITGFTRLT